MQSTKIGESTLFLKVSLMFSLANIHMFCAFNLLLFHINIALAKMVIAKLNEVLWIMAIKISFCLSLKQAQFCI